MVIRLPCDSFTVVRALIPSMMRSTSAGVGLSFRKSPLASTWFITERLKITSRAMLARFLVPVGEAAPSISGVMMLLSWARIVTAAS
jgi:hypothetical protein